MFHCSSSTSTFFIVITQDWCDRIKPTKLKVAHTFIFKMFCKLNVLTSLARFKYIAKISYANYELNIFFNMVFAFNTTLPSIICITYCLLYFRQNGTIIKYNALSKSSKFKSTEFIQNYFKEHKKRNNSFWCTDVICLRSVHLHHLDLNEKINCALVRAFHSHPFQYSFM